jgi:hypothetical protein
MSDSPPRPLSQSPNLKPSSPKRQPLHQRTESQSNTPSIRIVHGDSPQNIYSKSPFPTLPSQILEPRYAPFGNRGVHVVSVSDENSATNNAKGKSTKGEALVPRPLQLRKSNRASTSTTTSDPDTSFASSSAPFSASSSRFSSATSPPSSPVEDEEDRSETTLTPVHEERTPGPTATLRPQSTIRPVLPSPANSPISLNKQVSETSLASSASADTFAGKRADERAGSDSSNSSTNFVVFNRSSSSTIPAATSIEESERRPSAHNSTHTAATLSTESLALSIVFSDVSYTSNADRPRSSSVPAPPVHAGLNLRAAYASGAKVQFPAIRAPSSSGSWASSSSRPSLRSSPRMTDGPYRPPPWSSRLSTIPSESTERTSQSLSSGGLYFPRRRRTIGSITSDGLQSPSEGQDSIFEEGSGVLTGTESNVSLPYPPALFAPLEGRPLPPTPESERRGRDSDERDDTLGELQPPQTLRHQRSGFLGRFRPGSRPGSSDSTQSHSSTISFIGDLSWAKRYYSNGEPANLVGRSVVDLPSTSESNTNSRLNTATSGRTSSPVSETFPNSLWRPRNRPHQGAGVRAPRTPRTTHARESMAITEVSETSGRMTRDSVVDMGSGTFSPHLGRDRRAARYSAWQAPSLEDNPFGKKMFGPTNRQILLFAIGFICPLGMLPFRPFK